MEGSMRIWVATGALALMVAPATAQAPDAPSASKVDWTRVAGRVVDRWQLRQGERAVLFWQRTADRGAAAAIRKAITARGGVASGEIDVAEHGRCDRRRERRDPRARREAGGPIIGWP
jgi:hypothetical protein